MLRILGAFSVLLDKSHIGQYTIRIYWHFISFVWGKHFRYFGFRCQYSSISCWFFLGFYGSMKNFQWKCQKRQIQVEIARMELFLEKNAFHGQSIRASSCPNDYQIVHLQWRLYRFTHSFAHLKTNTLKPSYSSGLNVSRHLLSCHQNFPPSEFRRWRIWYRQNSNSV